MTRSRDEGETDRTLRLGCKMTTFFEGRWTAGCGEGDAVKVVFRAESEGAISTCCTRAGPRCLVVGTDNLERGNGRGGRKAISKPTGNNQHTLLVG